jgi:hypothetical protein
MILSFILIKTLLNSLHIIQFVCKCSYSKIIILFTFLLASLVPRFCNQLIRSLIEHIICLKAVIYHVQSFLLFTFKILFSEFSFAMYLNAYLLLRFINQIDENLIFISIIPEFVDLYLY